MTANQYQMEAMRTANKAAMNLLNGALGLCGEAGEVADLIKKQQFQGHELDLENLKSELGDVMWYMALLCSSSDLSLEEVMEYNVQKLKKRYPQGFSAESSVNREI